MRPWLALILAGLASMPVPAAPPRPVAQVDLARYMGTWHEIAKYPNRFQKGCGCTTATYALRPDGRVSVLNRCSSPKGDRSARGWAKVVGPGQLKVTFFWPFFGDYWILALDPEYRWALVGSPDRRYLWVLSRSPRMEEAPYQALLAEALDQGFDPARLVRTEPCGAVPTGGS